MKSVACKKIVCLQKRHLTAKKRLPEIKGLLAIFSLPAILSKADVKAQQALI
jgi:hypothetical protein